MRIIGILAGMVAAVLAAGTTLAHDPASHAVTRIEGPADDYVYQLAPPGSYALPRIKPAAATGLLDESGAPVDLKSVFAGRLTLLSFMYTRCGDACPLAALRLADLQRLASEEPALAQRVQIVSLSFDPGYDTPTVMAEYGGMMRLPDVAAPRWLFLTAPDSESLAPLLAAYDQPVARAAPDSVSGPFSHLLRAFLIDAKGDIRNIYSADFLDPRLLLNDLKTLSMEGS